MTEAEANEPLPERGGVLGVGALGIGAAIFIVAAAIRLAYVMALREHPAFETPTMDPGFHLAWARSLLEGEEFLDGPFFRAPLYPFALAAMLKVTGGSLVGVRVIQALLGALTAALTYRLGARVAGEAAGRIAGLLTAVSWTLVAFDAELLIPVLLLPILILALELTVVWRERAAGRKTAQDSLPSRLPFGLFVGLAFGLAAVVRPNVLLFMPVLFVCAIAWHRQLRPALWLTLGTLLPILPVTVHNSLEGDPSLIATQGGVNFWIGNNPSSDGSAAIVPGTRDGWWEGYYDSIAQAEAASGRSLKPTEVSSYYRGKATDWMAEQPGKALGHMAWKGRLLFANAELANNQDMRFLAFRTLPALRYSPARWGLLLGLGSVGLVALIVSGSRRRRRGAIILVAFGLVYALSIVLFFVNARFRLPLVPLLAIGTGAAFVSIWEGVRSRRWLSVLGTAVPAALLGALSFMQPAGYVSSDANGLAALAKSELARGNGDAAVRYLEQAIEANPASVQVRMALASALAAEGKNPERALILLREARGLPRGKDLIELELQILDTRMTAGDVDGALSEARTLLAKRPKDGALRFIVARGDALRGRGKNAVAALEALLLDEPTNAQAALAIAQILESLQDRDGAIRAYERLIALAAFASPSMIATARAKLAELRR